MNYIAVKQVWHAELNRYLAPGEVNDLAHLDDAEIAAMLEQGEIKLQEVRDGTHDSDTANAESDIDHANV